MRQWLNLFEMPITGWDVDPDLDANEQTMMGQWYGYDAEQKHWPDIDKASIRDPSVIERIKTTFLKVPYNFNLYFYQSTNPNYDSFLQAGVKDIEWIEKKIGSDAAKRIVAITTPDAITVVMTNNLSDERWVSVRSPWMIAHRLSHTIIAGDERSGASWEASYAFETFVEGITRYAYGVVWPKQDSSHGRIFHADYSTAYNVIIGKLLGTTRASREDKLTTPYEWTHEAFAQWLLTGSVKLNPLPSEIHPDELLTNDPARLEKAQRLWAAFPVKIDRLFRKALKEASGKIWVM